MSASAPELPAEVRREVAMLREEIESLLLEEASDGGARTAGLRDAHAGLSRYLGRAASDEGLIADVDAARVGLTSAAAALDDAARERDGALFDEALRLLATLRGRTLDLVASYPAGLDAFAARPFRASVGGPALHEAFDVPSPEIFEVPRPWDADPPGTDGPSETPALGPAAPDPDLSRLGRDALEDLGIFGNLRRLYDHEPWSDAREFEERLLANLDALWSLDRPGHPDLPRLGVPMATWRYATEWAAPDWGRAFALAITLGSVRSSLALRWVLLGMRRAPLSTLSAFIDGLSLASNPGIDEALLDLLRDGTDDVVAAALDVAARRRIFSAGAIVPLLAHPSEQVVLGAIRCVRNAPSAVAPDLLQRSVADARPRVALAALRELCAHGEPTARVELRRVLDDARAERRDQADGAEALRLLCLLGDPADEERVLGAALSLPACSHLLSFFGAPAHLDPLLGVLARLREAGATDLSAIARAETAIRRLSGVDASAAIHLVRAAALERLGTVPPRRVRFGVAYARDLVVSELRDGKSRQSDRRDLALELAIGWPDAPRLDVETWVARQEAELAAVMTPG